MSRESYILTYAFPRGVCCFRVPKGGFRWPAVAGHRYSDEIRAFRNRSKRSRFLNGNGAFRVSGL